MANAPTSKSQAVRAQLNLPVIDSELRQAACRAFNWYCADYFRAYADRMTPAACVPMHTPQETMAELENICLHQLQQ